jgi:hypothetical protein
MKCLALPFATEGCERLVRLPAIGISEVDSGRDHDIAHDFRQLADELLSIYRRACFDNNFIRPTAVLHDPTVLDVSVIDDLVTFLWRRHGEIVEAN